MASETDIANYALAAIGESPIVAFTDDSDRARIATVFYPIERDAILRAYPWKFASVRVALVLDGTAPIFGWTYRHALPSSPYCLRVLGVDEDYLGQIPWAVEARYLLSDESAIKIKYTAKITDPTQFDSCFTSAFIFRLAASFAFALTKQKTLVDAMMNVYSMKIQEARTNDSFEQSPTTVISGGSDFLDVR